MIQAEEEEGKLAEPNPLSGKQNNTSTSNNKDNTNRAEPKNSHDATNEKSNTNRQSSSRESDRTQGKRECTGSTEQRGNQTCTADTRGNTPNKDGGHTAPTRRGKRKSNQGTTPATYMSLCIVYVNIGNDCDDFDK